MPVTTNKQQRHKEKGLGESLKQNRVLIQYMHIDINMMKVKKEKKRQNKDRAHEESLCISWVCRAAAFSLAERSRRSRPWGRNCKEQTQFNSGSWFWVCCMWVPLAASNVLLLYLAPLHCLEPPAAPLPGSPRAARWGWGLWVEFSTTGLLVGSTGSGPGLWVWGTAVRYCHLTMKRCVLEFGIRTFFNLLRKNWGSACWGSTWNCDVLMHRNI